MAERYLKNRVAEEEGVNPVRVIGAPSWYRETMSDAEYDRHTSARLIGERDMFLDLPYDGLKRILDRLPEDF